MFGNKIGLSCFFCSIVKLLPRDAVDDLMRYCERPYLAGYKFDYTAKNMHEITVYYEDGIKSNATG